MDLPLGVEEVVSEVEPELEEPTVEGRGLRVDQPLLVVDPSFPTVVCETSGPGTRLTPAWRCTCTGTSVRRRVWNIGSRRSRASNAP